MTALAANNLYSVVDNPLDLAEEIAAGNEWAYERESHDELIIAVQGQYCEIQVRFFWREDYATLQTAAMIDTRVNDRKLPEIYETLALVNERMWLGHFEYWRREQSLIFRHASLANDPMTGMIGSDHVSTMMETVMTECDRFFPVFQFVLWGGKGPQEAIDMAMLECAGEA